MAFNMAISPNQPTLTHCCKDWDSPNNASLYLKETLTIKQPYCCITSWRNLSDSRNRWAGSDCLSQYHLSEDFSLPPAYVKKVSSFLCHYLNSFRSAVAKGSVHLPF